MSSLTTETVTSVRHWNDTLFSFRTTRERGFKFANGQFVMIGVQNEGKPLMRAYSIASPNHEEHLEFFSIKVQEGPLTSRLQKIQPGDSILVSRKSTGTLLLSDLRPGRRLLLLSTGTGLAPFISLVQDPEVYERFEKVILVHGVRMVSELAYAEFLTQDLPAHEYFSGDVTAKLVYYPTVTREPFRNRGRLTELLDSGRLFDDIGQPPLDPDSDRVMICGSPSMLDDCRTLLDARGFRMSGHIGDPADYVIERAFVER